MTNNTENGYRSLTDDINDLEVSVKTAIDNGVHNWKDAYLIDEQLQEVKSLTERSQALWWFMLLLMA